jgi:hypothetical protein
MEHEADISSELRSMLDDVRNKILVGRIQSQEVGKSTAILFSLITTIIAILTKYFVYVEDPISKIFYSVQSYALISFAFILFVWFIYPIVKFPFQKKKKIDMSTLDLPLKLLPSEIDANSVLSALFLPLIATFVISTIPLLYSSFVSSNQMPFLAFIVIIILIACFVLLLFNRKLSVRISEQVKWLKGLIEIDFIADNFGSTASIVILTLFSFYTLWSYFKWDYLITYQFWISVIFLLFAFLSFLAIYSYFDCKSELSRKLTNLITLYYVMDSTVSQGKKVATSDLEAFQKEIRNNDMPLVLQIRLLKITPLFFKVHLNKNPSP